MVKLTFYFLQCTSTMQPTISVLSNNNTMYYPDHRDVHLSDHIEPPKYDMAQYRIKKQCQ